MHFVFMREMWMPVENFYLHAIQVFCDEEVLEVGSR